MTTKTRKRRKPGRPRIEFDQKTADRICALLAQGLSLTAICRRKKMPSTDTVHRWRRENQQFSAAYVRAREDQGDTFADRVKDEADRTTPQNAQAQKVRIDALKWTAGAQNSRYADRQITAVQVNTGSSALPGDPEALILETARSLCFLLDSGDRVQREQQVLAALPAPIPALARQGETYASAGEMPATAAGMKQSTETPPAVDPGGDALATAEQTALDDAEGVARREMSRRELPLTQAGYRRPPWRR